MKLNVWFDGDSMSWTDWVCLCLVLFGFTLFLYGANFYDAIIGWIGVGLFFGGILSFLGFSIHRELIKKREKS